MFKKYFRAVLVLLCLPGLAQVGTWNNLPTLTEIRSLLPLADDILLASDGGLLLFNQTTHTFTTDIKGIQSNNLDQNIVYVDQDSLLWIGSRSPGPIIEVYDLVAGVKEQVEFVELDEITSFAQVGDSIYATYKDGLDGGLLLYRKGGSKIEYLDQFSNFSNQLSLDLSVVDDVVFLDNKLIFRSQEHILWVELNGTNLKDPLNWHVSDIPVGKFAISNLITNGTALFVTIDNFIYEYDYSDFNQMLYSPAPILDLQVDPSLPDRLVYTTSKGVFTYDIATFDQSQILSATGVQAIALSGADIWLASSSDFLGRISDQGFESYSANRPSDHLFNKMIIDAQGQLIGGGYHGLSILNDRGWRTIQAGSVTGGFNQNLYDWNAMIVDTLAYRGNAVVEDMITDLSGNLYLSLQGRGVLKISQELQGEAHFYTVADGVLEPTYDSDSYVLPGQMAVDQHNNVWLTNKLIRDGQSSMTILGADSAIYHINQYQGGLDSRTVKSIAIDANGFIWTGSQVRAELQATGGIHFIALNDSPGPDMDINVSILSGSPLADNEILQLEVDQQNTLWILTPAGVQSMVLPGRWLNTSELRSWANLYMTEKTSESYYYWQLTDYNVTSIEIDQRGNKWFLSSNAGVHGLQSNGRWFNNGYGYNTSNSDLLDNTVHSIAFDVESGQTYLSTSKGISILKTAFANPRENYSEMHIYPQPFKPLIHEKVIIQGLMDNSSIKILTIAGRFVRELTSMTNEVQGYEAQWDGRDANGDLVGSGVYILYIFNEDGEATSQKLAVLN